MQKYIGELIVELNNLVTLFNMVKYYDRFSKKWKFAESFISFPWTKLTIKFFMNMNLT